MLRKCYCPRLAAAVASAAQGEGTSSQSGSNGALALKAKEAEGDNALPSDLGELTASAYFENPFVGGRAPPFARGEVVERLSATEFAVRMADIHLSPLLEVGSRVYVLVGKTEQHEGRIIGGIVGKVNSDGTVCVLLDNDALELALPPHRIRLAEGRSRFTQERAYHDMLDWVQDAGVKRHADQERICSLLYHRGWREDTLYMLEGPDVHCMSYLNKSVRMSVLEKAEWQRLHHSEMRALERERVKEREWRYFVQKFSGFFSANWAALGVLSVFLWNFKNYRRQQRSYQLKCAVNTLTHGGGVSGSDKYCPSVERIAEENWCRQLLRQMDVTRPRVTVITGRQGCGKGRLFRSVIRKERKPTLYVEVRGEEDTLRCVVSALKVTSVDACGDYLEFITETFRNATKINGEPPILLIKLREGSKLSRVYTESVMLACERLLCHLVIEVPLESLTVANNSLPRMDFFTIPPLTTQQALQYTHRAIDPIALLHFFEVAGTSLNDIDELFAAVLHRKLSLTEYTNQKLSKAMRLLQSSWDSNKALKAAVLRLAEAEYEDGQHSGADSLSLHDPSLRDVVLYDPVHNRWLFRHKVLHTAARCWT